MALFAVMLALASGTSRADGRAGTVEWSDGRKMAGAISLSPGKDLRFFGNGAQNSLPLDEVKEMRFKPEKEEMWEGFYFPNAGQATQVKTGEVYPIRYLQTEITLSDGKVLEGHLFTTTLYVETDDATEKVVLMAKQTGVNGQKLAELAYPTLIRFEPDANAPAPASSEINLSEAGFSPTHSPLVVAEPNLTLPPMVQTPGKPIWTVPAASSGLILAVEAADGIHVSWPLGAYIGDQVTTNQIGPPAAPPADVDPLIRLAVKASLRDMQDFYDTRTLLGSFSGGDGSDIYSLVMMKRLGTTYSFGAGKVPWSLVLLRWKYDPDAKKTTLLNRVALATGRAEGNSQPPAVFKQPELLRAISGTP